MSHGRSRAPEHTRGVGGGYSAEVPELAKLTPGAGRLSSGCLCWIETESKGLRKLTMVTETLELRGMIAQVHEFEKKIK